MTKHEASRTLVKSTPELWAECSDAASLARHLGAFGEIRITKLEPETAVAWEGEDVRGTVTLQPSGWGTRVILTAVPQAGGAPVDEAPAAKSIPEAQEPAFAGSRVTEDVPPETSLPEPVWPKSVLPEASQPEVEPEAPAAKKSAGAPRPWLLAATIRRPAASHPGRRGGARAGGEARSVRSARGG